ncbi:MAG: peptidase T [Planctomycetaceae bacterium]|nr:peptidase T [Planctomycetaceae bacterium]
MDKSRLLERFLRYVRIDTTAREDTESYPSSAGQLELGRLLVAELQNIGLADAAQDQYGIVTATIPPIAEETVPVIAFCAHMDTSPETSGTNVQPQVIEKYTGGDIRMPGDPAKVIRVTECPALEDAAGCTLITSDGTTLLGADDKAGIAAIVEAAAFLMEHPDRKHGPVRICFTCDEEIGRGVDHIDLKQLGAAACYTLDGSGAGTIDVETFSADLATVSIIGKNIHPSIAKDKMINAVRAAGDFLARLPRDRLAPEVTEGREGFLHPYEVSGGVANVRIKILLRDFDTKALTDHAGVLRATAEETERVFPGVKIDVDVKRQYRNMADGLTKEPRAVDCAMRALDKLGVTAELAIVRGGTDGSRLTEMGLPTPNLSTGQHTPHSPLEWACLEEMVHAAEWIVAIAETWAEK